MRYLQTGLVRRDQLFWMIMRRDRRFTEEGRIWTEFEYSVPNQWQGRFGRLRVIGDKRGGMSTRRLDEHPELLERLKRTVGVEVKLVHVLRNPFDNIASMQRRGHGTLEQRIDDYFSRCRVNAALREHEGSSVLDVRHEQLISRPETCLRELCNFLGVETTADYLSDCAKVLYAAPHRSRTDVVWDPELIEDVRRRMAAFDFLSGYTYED